MISQVEMQGSYDKAKDVPHIGQRKRMRLNGKVQTMTLNQITAKRHRSIECDEAVIEFTTEESWGDYY